MPIMRMCLRRTGSPSGATGGPSARVLKQLPKGFDPPPDSLAALLLQKRDAVLVAFDGTEDLAKANKQNKNLTDLGQADAKLVHALTQFVPVAHSTRQLVTKANQELAARLAKLTLPEPPQSEFGIRKEIRERIRTMDIAEQRRLSEIPQVEQSILEVPEPFSGVPPELYARIRQRALQRIHGREREIAAQLAVAIAATADVVDAAREEVRHDLNLSRSEFDQAAAHIERKHDAVWLRERNGSVEVVDLERRIGRAPTPDELKTGIRANTIDEYNAAKIAVAV